MQAVLDAHAPSAKEKSHQSWLSKVFQVLFNIYLVAFISNEKKTQFKLSGKEQYGNRVKGAQFYSENEGKFSRRALVVEDLGVNLQRSTTATEMNDSWAERLLGSPQRSSAWP